jgi:hypothetical protein
MNGIFNVRVGVDLDVFGCVRQGRFDSETRAVLPEQYVGVGINSKTLQVTLKYLIYTFFLLAVHVNDVGEELTESSEEGR